MLTFSKLLAGTAVLTSLCASFAQGQSLTITLAGQSMIRSDIRETSPKALPTIKGLLKGDVLFTNLEAAIAMPGETVHEGRGFLTPPAALDSLSAFGFNLLSLSGNHAYDLGVTGIQNTLREVEARKIAHSGTGKTLAEATAPGYLKTPNGTIGLVASASGLIVAGGHAESDHPGVNELRVMAGDKPNEASADLPGAGLNTPVAEDANRILASIKEAKQHSDLVVVYQHNHVFSNHSFASVFTEELDERLAPNQWLQKWVHAEIDAGADIVVMHGAPLLHGIEIYKGKPIFYDLGNFIYNLPPWLTYIHEPINFESAVAYLQYEGKQLKSIQLQPIVLNYLGEGQPDVHDEYANNQFIQTRGLPSPATGARANYILERVAGLSKPFGTTLEIKDGKAEIKLGR
jgi:poly-gamma-glutamate synthesis protein (capsule biosynthesis protein)